MAAFTSKFREDNISHSDGLILGIDIGTTSIKTAIIEHNTRQIIARQNIEHCAQIESVTTDNLRRHEQLVGKILVALNKCVEKLSEELLKDVKDIAICGQMHGCVLWKREKLVLFKGDLTIENKLQHIGDIVSPLITWEDGRCTPQFLSSLPKACSFSPLASGFGCATLFWLQKHMPEVLERYDSAGTVMDLVVSSLCAGLSKVLMSSQNACSWGYYDVDGGKWEFEKLQSQNFPVHLLPEICEPGHIVGRLSQRWCAIPSDTVVRVALGDMQCSILATLADPTDAVLNIGTSAQLSVIVTKDKKDEIFQEISSHPALQIAPYFNKSCLVVAAALTGGNALAFFVEMLQNWVTNLGVEAPPKSIIYKKLSECSNLDKDSTKLIIKPVLWGERHDPNQTASVTGVSCESLSLGNVYNSLCHGLVSNIQSMMTNEFLRKCEVNRITGTGNTLARNWSLQESVQNVFKLPFVLCNDADASVGAALSILST